MIYHAGSQGTASFSVSETRRRAFTLTVTATSAGGETFTLERSFRSGMVRHNYLVCPTII